MNTSQLKHPKTYTAEPEVLDVSGGCVKTVAPEALATVMFCAAMCDRYSGGSWPSLEMDTWKVCTSPTSCHGHTSAGPPAHDTRQLFECFCFSSILSREQPHWVTQQCHWQQTSSLAQGDTLDKQPNSSPSALVSCTAALGCVLVMTPGVAASAASRRSSTLWIVLPPVPADTCSVQVREDPAPRFDRVPQGRSSDRHERRPTQQVVAAPSPPTE